MQIRRMKKRKSTLLNNTRKADASALVAFEPENLFYMTGFWGEAIGVLSSNGNTTIIAPELEAERAKADAPECDIVPTERNVTLSSALGRIVGNDIVCTDAKNPSDVRALKKACKQLKQDPSPFVESRMLKDASEVRTLQYTSKVIDEMFEMCTQVMHVGQRESELQAKLMSFAAERELFDTGYRYTTNPLIIASGPNSAIPHAQVTQRKFERGDLVTVDITLRHHGYVSDATRTFGVGHAGDKERNIYSIVKEAQERGLGALAVNASCKSIDAACRDCIFSAGYGARFVHSTGHGIGLDVHEPPAISARSTQSLVRGMAITIEPGIYISNTFGVRIEDSIIIRKKSIPLHEFTKDLIIV